VGGVVHELSKRLKVPAEDFVADDAAGLVESGIHSVADEYEWDAIAERVERAYWAAIEV
jgi:hypothetical protein